MTKTNPGRFFEDYTVGQTIRHAVPRTVAEGERALYHALYPARHALYSSDEFAITCGLDGSPLDDLLAFHTVFGKTVPDVSLNAVANLGYAQGRWLAPVWPGDTLRSESQVIGLKQNSNGKSGVVWVRTQGLNQMDQPVLDYVRWVMVRKRDTDAPAPETVVPDLPPVVAPEDLVTFKYEDQGVATLEDGLYVLESTLEDDAKVTDLVKFVRASMKGWKYAEENPEEAAQIVLDNDETGAQTLDHQVRMVTEIGKLTAGSDGTLDEADYQRTVDTLMAGGSDPVISAAPEGAFTHMITDRAFD